ncbi:beta-lactamase regulating signal transducer with metallopeptidase domain [Chitinophaga polysaccharea]|uniref:Beta-lactamase regulating signal transducer with metallopeptidase domain n=1 Tax=Chitinophaga polysaccharea TaxID=1293035 RepID=A0A561Q2Q1_9BACT|nr:M56 family metallopeptidase [Chitinophaga polysaccharea]TWF44648.1 beta-lactamase regulating signal transducer with metallopeptidase domain [Chitinophaga polysaccharea]
MPTLFLYLLQASGAIALFYLLYISCFRRETFYRYNRILLLSTFVFSALLPLLPVPAMHWSKVVTPEPGNAQVYFADHLHNASAQTAIVTVTHWWDPLLAHGTTMLLAIYAAVALSLAIIHGLQLLKINRLAKFGDVYYRNRIRYVHIEKLAAPFSFLNTIFIDHNAYEHTEFKHILQHEEAHVKQYHSVDMLLSAFYCCLFWINPFAWLCKKALQLNLEFLADDAVVTSSLAPVDYQYSLLRLGTPRTPVAIVSHFSKSFIKNRILMMNKTQSPRLRTWRYLLLLPVLALTAGLLSATTLSSKNDVATNKYVAIKNGITYVVVTPLTSDDDLAGIKNTLEAKGMTVTLNKLKRNSDGKISVIDINVKDRFGSLSERSDDNPIHTFFLCFNEKEISVGPYPPKNCPQNLLEVAEKESDGQLKGFTSDTTYVSRFPGGKDAYRKFLAKNIRYPKVCRDNNIVGLVTSQYKIQPDGKVTNVEVLMSPSPAMGEEIKRVLGTLPDFNPAKNKNVITVTTSIAFNLQGDTPEKSKNVSHLEEADIVVIGYK